MIIANADREKNKTEKSSLLKTADLPLSAECSNYLRQPMLYSRLLYNRN
jgi:hypothetical protein